MTLGQLKVFEAVARHLNLTKAARELHVSEPTISKQVHSLEKRFGVKLHLSTGQGIKLTEEGRFFLSAIGHILQQLQEVEARIKSTATDGEPVRLRVGGSIAPSASLLPEMLKTFQRNHPKVQPVLRTGPSKAVEEMLLNGEVEVALITHPSHNPLITVEPFRQIAVIAAISAKHRWARKSSLNEHEFGRAPIIVVKDGTIARHIDKIGLKLKIFMECESLEAAKAAVLAGLGMGIFYHSSIELDLRAGYLKAIDVPRLHEIDGSCFIAYLTAAQLQSNTVDFLALLRQYAKRNMAPRFHAVWAPKTTI